MIWLIIIDFLKLFHFHIKQFNALLSLFLTADHYSWGVFFPAKGLNVPYFEWHLVHVQLRHICQPQTWSHQDSKALGIFLGLFHPYFSSSQSQYLAPSKGCADLVFFWLLLWQNPQLFLPYIWLILFPCIQVFSQKRHVTGQQWLLTDLLF